MKIYAVYRYDYIRHVRVPVGMVLERRKRERGTNFKCLVKLAQKKYSKSSFDSEIVILPISREDSTAWAEQ
jgi:hypothetical protein